MKFYVGIGSFKLDLKECRSLKDKRQVVKSILDRIGNSRVLSACEVGGNDYWKNGTLAVSCVSPSHDIVKKSLSRARQVIDHAGIEVLEQQEWVFKPEDIAE